MAGRTGWISHPLSWNERRNFTQQRRRRRRRWKKWAGSFRLSKNSARFDGGESWTTVKHQSLTQSLKTCGSNRFELNFQFCWCFDGVLRLFVDATLERMRVFVFVHFLVNSTEFVGFDVHRHEMDAIYSSPVRIGKKFQFKWHTLTPVLTWMMAAVSTELLWSDRQTTYGGIVCVDCGHQWWLCLNASDFRRFFFLSFGENADVIMFDGNVIRHSVYKCHSACCRWDGQPFIIRRSFCSVGIFHISRKALVFISFVILRERKMTIPMGIIFGEPSRIESKTSHRIFRWRIMNVTSPGEQQSNAWKWHR